jgi:hypothetical protein
MTDQVDVLDCRRVEPAAEPACQFPGGEPHSEPRQIEQVNTAPLRQRLENRQPPAPGTREPMYKDNRFSLSGDPILARLPVDHELANLHEGSVSQRLSECGYTRMPDDHPLWMTPEAWRGLTLGRFRERIT